LALFHTVEMAPNPCLIIWWFISLSLQRYILYNDLVHNNSHILFIKSVGDLIEAVTCEKSGASHSEVDVRVKIWQALIFKPTDIRVFYMYKQNLADWVAHGPKSIVNTSLSWASVTPLWQITHKLSHHANQSSFNPRNATSVSAFCD